MSNAEATRITKDGNLIHSVDTWYRLAPPKAPDKHWVDGGSAKELAKAWFPAQGAARVPAELVALLSGHADFRGAVMTEGTPEVRIKLDGYPGETRNADLVLLAQRDDETILLTVEAKADEEFDVTIAEKLRSAEAGSNIPQRVDHLCKALFGATPAQEPVIKGLRYQLLHGVAATLIVARDHGASKALFVIHEFVTVQTAAQKRAANHADLVAFVKRLARGTVPSVVAGGIVGPLTVPGGKHVPAGIPLYLGKITRNVR